MPQRQPNNDRADLGVKGTGHGQDAKQQDLQREREHPEGETLTTNQGIKITDNQNSLKAGTGAGGACAWRRCARRLRAI